MNIGGLGHKKGGQGHVDAAAICIESVAGGHDQADQSLRAAEALHLFHQCRQRRLGRAQGEAQDDLFLDIRKESDDSETGGPANRSQHHKHKEDRRDPNRADELRQRNHRSKAVLAYGEGHGAKSANRSSLHYQIHHAEDSLRQSLDGVHQGLDALAHH